MDKEGSAAAHTQVAPGVHKIGARLEELAPGARLTGVMVGHETHRRQRRGIIESDELLAGGRPHEA